MHKLKVPLPQTLATSLTVSRSSSSVKAVLLFDVLQVYHLPLLGVGTNKGTYTKRGLKSTYVTPEAVYQLFGSSGHFSVRLNSCPSYQLVRPLTCAYLSGRRVLKYRVCRYSQRFFLIDIQCLFSVSFVLALPSFVLSLTSVFRPVYLSFKWTPGSLHRIT